MIFGNINTDEVENRGHVVLSHPCKCGLGVPVDCSGFSTTNEPTERPMLLDGVRHLRGDGLFRRHLAYAESTSEGRFARYKGWLRDQEDFAKPQQLAQTGWLAQATDYWW